ATHDPCSVNNWGGVGDAPAVVLLHGVPTRPAHLWPLARRLSQCGFRVLVPHMPGYGLSVPMPSPYHLGDSQRLLAESLAAHGVEKGHLVGFSGGAWRAFELATSRKFHARSVVGLGPIAQYTTERQHGLATVAAALRTGFDLRETLVNGGLSAAGRRN